MNRHIVYLATMHLYPNHEDSLTISEHAVPQKLQHPGIQCKEDVGQDSQEHTTNIICNKNPF